MQAHRESFDAHCEGHDEDVPAGAEPGHGEAEEDEDEEPDDHPQRIRAVGPGTGPGAHFDRLRRGVTRFSNFCGSKGVQ